MKQVTKAKTHLLLGFVLFTCSSCLVSGPQINLYGPPHYSSQIAYQPKPLSSDSIHHASYISASYFSAYAPNSNNDNDDISGGQLNIGQGFTFKNFNVAYGAFGSLGSYHNLTNTDATQPDYFNSKFFGNTGGRFSANAFVTSGNVDIRLIGFEMAYTHEFGAYEEYRKSVTGVNNYFTDTRTDLVTLGGSSEVSWHSGKQPIQFGLRLFIGHTLGNNSYKNPNAPGIVYNPYPNSGSLAYFMQIKRYFVVGEANTNGGQLRAGMRF